MAEEPLPSPSIPSDLRARAENWATLKRWERRDVARALRRLGSSYSEIARIVPVSKGTLSGWCRDVELDGAARARLRARRPRAAAMAENGARRRASSRARHLGLRTAGALEAAWLMADPLWMAGVVAYWSEGAKTSNRLIFSNSDPAMARLFIRWTRTFLGVGEDRFIVRLNLHSGQDRAERIEYWSTQLDIPVERFGSCSIKSEGSGHRKNVLWAGTATIKVRRSTNDFHRVAGWIERVRSNMT